MTARSLTPLSVAQRRGNLAVADYLASFASAIRHGPLTSPCPSGGSAAHLAYKMQHMDSTTRSTQPSQTQTGPRTPRTPRTPRSFQMTTSRTARHPPTPITSSTRPRPVADVETERRIATPSIAVIGGGSQRESRQLSSHSVPPPRHLRRHSPRPSSAGRYFKRATSRENQSASYPSLAVPLQGTPRRDATPTLGTVRATSGVSAPESRCPSPRRSSPCRKLSLEFGHVAMHDQSEHDTVVRGRHVGPMASSASSDKLRPRHVAPLPRTPRCRQQPTPERPRPPRMPAAVGGA